MAAVSPSDPTMVPPLPQGAKPRGVQPRGAQLRPNPKIGKMSEDEKVKILEAAQTMAGVQVPKVKAAAAATAAVTAPAKPRPAPPKRPVQIARVPDVKMTEQERKILDDTYIEAPDFKQTEDDVRTIHTKLDTEVFVPSSRRSFLKFINEEFFR